jgi:hypothetical protein
MAEPLAELDRHILCYSRLSFTALKNYTGQVEAIHRTNVEARLSTQESVCIATAITAPITFDRKDLASHKEGRCFRGLCTLGSQSLVATLNMQVQSVHLGGHT